MPAQWTVTPTATSRLGALDHHRASASTAPRLTSAAFGHDASCWHETDRRNLQSGPEQTARPRPRRVATLALNLRPSPAAAVVMASDGVHGRASDAGRAPATRGSVWAAPTPCRPTGDSRTIHCVATRDLLFTTQRVRRPRRDVCQSPFAPTTGCATSGGGRQPAGQRLFLTEGVAAGLLGEATPEGP